MLSAASAFLFAPVRGAEVMVELPPELLMLEVRSQILSFSPGGYTVVCEEEHLLSSNSGDGGLARFRRYPRLPVVPTGGLPDLVQNANSVSNYKVVFFVIVR